MRLMTAPEVAAQLRVQRSWVYDAARAGRLPHLRLGRYIRFDPDDIEEWIRQQRSGGTVKR